MKRSILRRLFLAIFLITFAAGCASTGRFVEATGNDSEVATIQIAENLNFSMIRSDSISVRSINGLPSPFWWLGRSPLKIPPGDTRLDLTYRGRIGLLGLGQGEATSSYHFQALPGKNYEIGAVRVEDRIVFYVREIGAKKDAEAQSGVN